MDFELPGEDHPQRKAVRAWFEANPQASGICGSPLGGLARSCVPQDGHAPCRAGRRTLLAVVIDQRT